MIRTMQLVGAKSFFIRKPFLIKAFYRVDFFNFSSFILVKLMVFIYNYKPNIISELSSDKFLLNNKIFEFSVIALGILITGILISIVSTYFALNKFIWIKYEKLLIWMKKLKWY